MYDMYVHTDVCNYYTYMYVITIGKTNHRWKADGVSREGGKGHVILGWRRSGLGVLQGGGGGGGGVRRVPHTRPILCNTFDMMTGLGVISLSKLLT